MSRIILADLHLDSDPLTEYRWGIFDKLYDILSQDDIQYVDILGDLTEKKDKHDSSLVNRLIYNIQRLADLATVRILMGNHDYIDPSEPFFGFLNEIRDVYFVYHPTKLDDTCFSPNNKAGEVYPDPSCDFLYLHLPFVGARAQGGYYLQEGSNLSSVATVKSKIFSGDIHTPQVLENVEYVGAPYHVYFGDNYDGRIILLNSDGQQDIFLDFPKRHMVILRSLEDLGKYDFSVNDQAKVRVELEKDKLYLWDEWKESIKDFLKKEEVLLVSLELKPIKETLEEMYDKGFEEDSPKDIIDRFAGKEKLTDEFIELAYEVVDETEKAKNKRV